MIKNGDDEMNTGQKDERSSRNRGTRARTVIMMNEHGTGEMIVGATGDRSDD
jgi:hypothetical protein